jgi:hypothetical protein
MPAQGKQNACPREARLPNPFTGLSGRPAVYGRYWGVAGYARDPGMLKVSL